MSSRFHGPEYNSWQSYTNISRGRQQDFVRFPMVTNPCQIIFEPRLGLVRVVHTYFLPRFPSYFPRHGQMIFGDGYNKCPQTFGSHNSRPQKRRSEPSYQHRHLSVSSTHSSLPSHSNRR